MRRTLLFPALAAIAALTATVGSARAQQWGPPPPGAPLHGEEVPGEDEVVQTSTQPEQQNEGEGEQGGGTDQHLHEDLPVPTEGPAPTPPTPTETATQATVPPTVPTPQTGEGTQAGTAAAPGQTETTAAEPPPTGPARLLRYFDRFEFHGYARMPLNLHFRPVGEGEEVADIDRPVPFRTRSPFLVDNDYYLSGFAYTRLYETDWAELYFSAAGENVDVTVGLFASLFSDWAYASMDRQFGIAQASVTFRHLAGVGPLSLQAGMFWDRLGYVDPYDTYVFGRTHQAGVKLGWDFPCGARIRAGVGAHLEVLQQNQGFTPLVYAYGGSPIGPVTLNAYLLFVWNDDVRPMSTTEEGDLVVFGMDVRVDWPWFDGPLYLALAGYWAERSLFLANAFELLHSTGGRGLTENFFGIQESDNGTGSVLVGAIDWPVNIWRGISVHFFGMLAHVWSEQDLEDPLLNRDDRTYLKWGIEPAYQALRWLRISLRYDRVILDMDTPGLAFRAITPTVTLTAVPGVDFLIAYSHYFYGEELHLRPNQVPGGITEPDEDVMRLMARATW